ncbi:MAG TPA: ATP-binding protein [Rhodocyclaceae bacterium]|nr:ATP-binding protein [Rhodocyclaceae bacterium]
MTLITWSDSFATGIEVLDVRHRVLLDLINTATSLLAQAGDTTGCDVQPRLDDLLKYATVHFQLTEAAMLEGGIDTRYLARRKETHAAFIQEATLLRNELSNTPEAGRDLRRFLQSWLIFHILAENQNMAQQLRLVAAGTQAGQAYDLAGNDSAAALLNDALCNLFDLVARRDQTQLATRERLCAEINELSESYTQLDALIAARTKELWLTNVALQSEQKALIEAMTKIEQAQGQLLQSEKMATVGQLTAGIAHEINNPIGFISSNLGSLSIYIDKLFAVLAAYERLAAELPDTHPARLATEAARKAAEIDYLCEDIPELLRESSDGLTRVKRIVSDLKDFSHINEGEWKYSDIHNGLESTLNIVWNEIKYKATVKKEFGDLPPVKCIPSLINQVLMNLLVNAAHAIETTGSITLRTGTEERNVWVEVIDSGKGMTPEIQARIFEPFFTTKPVGKGTGLGLSIAWDIMQRHNGRIEVRSEPGQGACFRLTLPIEPPSTETV